jgi:hypothetical protein
MELKRLALLMILASVSMSRPAIAQALYPYKIVPVPKTPVSHHTLFGTITAMNGSMLSVQTRHGLISVDAASAVRSDLSTVLFVGRVVEIKGNYDESGILHANVILRAKSSPFMWGADT